MEFRQDDLHPGSIRLPSAEHLPGKDHMTIALEQLDPGFVEEVIPNQYALDVLDSNHQYLASEAFALENLFMTVPITSPHVVEKPAGFYHGRNILITDVVARYKDFIGTCVFGKGFGVSGEMYDDHTQAQLFSRHGYGIGLNNAPVSQKDTMLSNGLIARDYRSSLNLVQVIWKTEKLRKAFVDAWIHTPMAAIYEEGFDGLRAKNEQPVGSFRLSGHPARLVNTLSRIESKSTLIAHARSGLVLHALEAQNNLPYIHGLLQESDIGPAAFIRSVQSLQHQTDHLSLETVFRYFYALECRNLFAALSLQTDTQSKVKIANNGALHSIKDIDMSLTDHPFESAVADESAPPATLPQLATSFIEQAATNLTHVHLYLRRIKPDVLTRSFLHTYESIHAEISSLARSHITPAFGFTL